MSHYNESITKVPSLPYNAGNEFSCNFIHSYLEATMEFCFYYEDKQTVSTDNRDKVGNNVIDILKISKISQQVKDVISYDF